MSTNDIDVAGDGECEHLLASPEWLGFEDGWLWHLAIPRGQPHQEVHHILLGGGGAVHVIVKHKSSLVFGLTFLYG